MIALYGTKCTDFADGMLAILQPLSCKVKERAGGEFSLYMELPLIANGAHTAVQKGYLIRCPVPKRETPLITNTFSGTGGVPERVIYRTKNKASLRTKGYVDAPVIEWLKKGTEVLFNGTFGMINHSVVTSPSGNTGRIYNEVIEYVRTEPAIPGKPAYNSIVPARQVRDQFFRIYELERDTGAGLLRVWARHISYDLLHTLLLSYDPENADASAAITGFKNAMDHDDGFAIYSNVSGTVNGQWDGKNAIFALQDPEQGLVRQLDAQLVRDNYDIFLLKNEEIDRGFVIESGKNLKSVKEKISADKIVTRLVPYYSGKDGKRIYLPEKFVDASNVGDHPGPRTALLEVQIERDLAQEAAFLKMREACQKEFEKGVNLPDVQIEVDFISAADIEEFKHIRALQQVFLYDVVKIKSAELGLTFSAAVNEIEYDAVLDRYLYLGIGKINTVEEMGSIASYQLSSGSVSGTKISVNSVNSHHLKKLSINKAHIQNAAIESAHIAYAAIEEANIKDAAVSSAKIKAAAIDNAKISEAGIDYAKIKDLVSGTAIIEAGIGEKLIIKRLSVTDANVVNLAAGKLLVQGQDGAMYQLTVGADGTVTTIKKQIGNNDVKNESLHAGEKIIKGTIVADLLNVQEIFANSALIGAIKAQNIAAQEITVNHLAADVGRTLDISSNESITLKANQADLEKIKEYGQNLLKNSGRKYTSTAYHFGKYEFDEELEEGETFTFSAKIKLGANKQYLLLYNSGGSVSNAWLNMSYQHDGIWQYTGQWTKKNGQNITADNKSLWLFAYPSDAVSQTEVEWVKIERGDRVTPWCPAYGEAKELKSSHISIDDDKIAVKSGGIVDVEAGGHLHLAGGTVQIDAQESNGSHINLGNVFSVGENENGEYELHLNAKDNAMKVNGNDVWHRGNIVISPMQPAAGNRVIWLKPNAVVEVVYLKAAASGRSFYFGWGYGANGYLNFDLMPQSQGVISAGTFAVTLTFLLTRKGSGAIGSKNYGHIEVFLKKGGKTLSAMHSDDIVLRPYQSKLFTITFSTTSPDFTNNTNAVSCGIRVTRPQYNDRDFLCFKTPSDITAKFVTSGSAGAGLCEVRYVP